MAKVIIFGNSQIAETAYFYLRHDSPHDIVAFTVNQSYLTHTHFHELPVIAFEDIKTHYPPSEYSLFIPMSYRKFNKARAQKFYQAKQMGYSLISYISSKATYYNTPVGENCFIFENNVIQPYTSIGDNCILWSGNHIGHHTKIGNHCFLASHVVIGGSVTVGEYTLMGVNATLRDNITIGAHNIIGAGALLLSDTQDGDCFVAQETKRKNIRVKKP